MLAPYLPAPAPALALYQELVHGRSVGAEEKRNEVAVESFMMARGQGGCERRCGPSGIRAEVDI